MAKIEHTVFRNGNLFCTHCGMEYVLTMPIPIDQMTKTIEVFNGVHADCKKTWKEPVADHSKSIRERALWWLQYSETGASSKTMYNCLTGNRDFEINHPHDADDFSRCYKLLLAIPEWRKELHKLKRLSQAWSNLVDNWDKLTEMYEAKEPSSKMYNFMQTLIN